MTTHVRSLIYQMTTRVIHGLIYLYYVSQFTRTVGSTGSDYLFIVFNKKIRCLSLTTGQTLVKNGPLPMREQLDEDEDEEEEEPEQSKDICRTR